MVWAPRVSVAAVIEREGRFLTVEEVVEGGAVVLNQPAGHLEEGETLIEAVRREVLEETATHFRPVGLVGLYLYTNKRSDVSYLHVCFHGEAIVAEPGRLLDRGILRTLWLTLEELQARSDALRSPLVARCLEDYRSGHRFPLDLIADPIFDRAPPKS
jgi:ADP-ribose pyrophosphatase YjhB (NUDIX family)